MGNVAQPDGTKRLEVKMLFVRNKLIEDMTARRITADDCFNRAVSEEKYRHSRAAYWLPWSAAELPVPVDGVTLYVTADPERASSAPGPARVINTEYVALVANQCLKTGIAVDPRDQPLIVRQKVEEWWRRLTRHNMN